MSSQCEMIKCQVRIDRDVANVLMVATVDAGKVEKLEVRVDEFYAQLEK